MSSSRLILKRALGAGRKLTPSQQTSTQLSTLSVPTTDQLEKNAKYEKSATTSKIKKT